MMRSLLPLMISLGCLVAGPATGSEPSVDACVEELSRDIDEAVAVALAYPSDSIEMETKNPKGNYASAADQEGEIRAICEQNADQESRRVDVKLPATVEAAVADVLSQLSVSDKELIRGTSKSELIQFHRGLGTTIRNNYDLWGSNTGLLIAACGHDCHPDDASMVIIRRVWESLQAQDER